MSPLLIRTVVDNINTFLSFSSLCYSKSRGRGVYYKFLKPHESDVTTHGRTTSRLLPLTNQVMTAAVLCHHPVDSSDSSDHALIKCEDCPSRCLWPGSAAETSGRPRHTTQGSETPAAGHRCSRSDACT